MEEWKLKTVGVREFRDRMAEYLASDTPLAITRHGQTVGFYVPARARAGDEAEKLPQAIRQLREAMAHYATSETEATRKLDEKGRLRSGLAPSNASSFWEHKSIEQLAEEQGVGPVRSWEQLQGYWPEDADFEEFLAAVESARKR